MRIVVTANGADLDASASPIFGRCPWYLFVDTDTMEVEATENPAVGAAGGAGIQAAQFVVERGAEAVLTGNVGPNAFDVFQSARVPVYLIADSSAREAVNAYKADQLPEAGGATGPAHAGMGRAPGMGRSGGRGRARQGLTGGGPAAPAAGTPSVGARADDDRDREVDELKSMAAGLRGQLAEVMDRLDRLEKGE